MQDKVQANLNDTLSTLALMVSCTLQATLDVYMMRILRCQTRQKQAKSSGLK